MIEPDDRLAGDLVWELFPESAPTSPLQGWRYWAVFAGLIASAWLIAPPLSIVVACLAGSLGEFRAGLWIRRTITDKAGGTIGALFRHAWGAWKLGGIAFLLMFPTAVLAARMARGGQEAPPPAFFAAVGLWMAGWLASSLLTAAGLVLAFRSGMRVWVGEGVNQARTLLLSMILAAFTCAVLIPGILFLTSHVDPGPGQASGGAVTIGILAFQIGVPVLILVLVDRLGRRVLADRPGKFGPKVPTIAKWEG